MDLKTKLTQKLNKNISESSNEELYCALLELVKELAGEKEQLNDGKKKLYYISAEFLIGKLLSNNMINLGIYQEIREILGADSLGYLEMDRLKELSAGRQYCDGCFSGNYPMEPPKEDIRGEHDETVRKNKKKN